ncbi:MAG: hypothetical protein GX859_03375 [Corynebacterium humireducens]|jgi:hypothetical protein|uniref:Uncharacterized protein n=1 Tax=Corynebacterium humireducens TaxID=1223514 RepID=A0A7X6PLS1_9CORY|nr:hypothetical protein [Corynebacterium humireducens]
MTTTPPPTDHQDDDPTANLGTLHVDATTAGVKITFSDHDPVELTPAVARQLAAGLSTAADAHAAAAITTDDQRARLLANLHHTALTLTLATIDADDQRYGLTLQDALQDVSLTQLTAHLIRALIDARTGGDRRNLRKARRAVHAELLQALAYRDESGW